MTWFMRDDRIVFGEIVLTEHQQGPPGYVHGGASAALLDEAMGMAVWAAGYRVVAVNLNVDFSHPVPLGVKIAISARVIGQEGRAIHASGEIALPDGQIAVVSKGVYVEAPHLVGNVRAEHPSPSA